MNEQEQPDPLIGRFLINQYKIIRKLGQGGFGAVYEAYQPSLDRKIAIKVMHLALTQSPEAITRFRREGLIATKLKHPSTVEVYTLGQTDEGHLWLAMEYVEGQTLEHYLRQHRTLTPQDIFDIVSPVLDVLAEAHDKGVVHRDLKPDNIMLSVYEGQRIAKVLDFGISSLQGSDSATHAAMVSGTPQYMAPEQWEGMAMVDARSDLYSMGVILYRALSARFPFQADSPLAWMKKHHMEEPLDLAIAMGNQSISPALHHVVMKCIAKSPIDRQQSAVQLKEELQIAISASPVVSPIVTEVVRPPIEMHAHVMRSNDCLLWITRTDTGDLFAAGEYGIIVWSDDNSESWGIVESRTEMGLHFIWSQPRLIIAVGEQGTITCSKEGTHWEIRPSHTKSVLRAVWGNSTRVFVVGHFGAALVSEDNGESFQTIQLGTRESFCAVWGFDTTVFVGGTNGTLLRSRDNGGTWQRVTLPPLPRTTITSIHGRSATEIYLVTSDGHMLSTHDGEGFKLSKLWDGMVRQIQCLPDGRLASLTDSGEFCLSIEEDHWRGGPVEGYMLRSMLPEKEQIFFVGKDNAIVRYKDEVFEEKFCGTFPHLMSCHHDESEIFLCGANGSYVYSGDEGVTWHPTQRSDLPTFNCIHRPKGGLYFYTAGIKGHLSVFERGAQSWDIKLATVADVYFVWSSAPNDVYVLGELGKIHHTEDEGGSWQERESGVAIPLVSMWGNGPDELYIVGFNGLILYSSDRGFTWEKQESGTHENLHCIYGFASGDIFIVGDKGVLLFSSNKGLSWQKRFSTSKEDLSGIHGDSLDDLFVCGTNGTLLHSRDKGWTWQSWPTNTKLRLVGALRTKTSVVAFGYHGVLLYFKTTIEEDQTNDITGTMEGKTLLS